MNTDPKIEHETNFYLSMAVGMGIPFRAVIALVVIPFWLFALFGMIVVDPYGGAVMELLNSAESFIGWIWSGKRR